MVLMTWGAAIKEYCFSRQVLTLIGLTILFFGCMSFNYTLLRSTTVQVSLLPLGLFAIWRYSWWLNHYLRATIFLRIVFPHLRLRAMNVEVQPPTPDLYIIVTSFNIPRGDFRRVYAALFQNVIDSRAHATVIASVTSEDDKIQLLDLYQSFREPSKLRVVVQYQLGVGKRDALAEALRVIARSNPLPGSLTVFLDGDVILPKGALRNCSVFFQLDPKLGALTTNNNAYVRGNKLVTQWFLLRHAQRHLLMCSLALSHRLLVLTGRFSMFRSDVTTESEFIRLVGADQVSHWRLGQIKLLSGDDKSTWFYLVKKRRRMLYVPDVVATSIEDMPSGSGALIGSSKLMLRWFGNMLRANGRALHLGPVKTTPFLWLCLFDQRVSMWTGLLGPLAAVMAAIIFGPIIFLQYILWTISVKSMMSVALATIWGRAHLSWPALLLYNQVWGAILKGWISHRLDRQVWTRQNITLRSRGVLLRRFTDHVLHAFSIAFLVLLAWAGLTYEL
jgi:mannuronan synthase